MSMKKVAGITALVTAMAFVNSANDLTIVGDNNVCYAKVVRRVTRNVVIQKKSQPADNAQSTPKFGTSYTETEPAHREIGDTPDSDFEVWKEKQENTKLKENEDLKIDVIPVDGIDYRLGETTVQIEQYMKANPRSGFSVVTALNDYEKYNEYLNNNYKTYAFKSENFNTPIVEPIAVDGNLIIEESMYIALQSDNYELTVKGNLIICGNGSIKCCMEKANATGLNTVRVEGNIVFDGNTHKMSFAEQSYGFTMPANYARSTQKLNFSSAGTWYAMNGKSDDYYNLKQVSKTQTKYLTDVPKPDVPSVFDKKGNGDVNGDGVVNDADVELLRKYLTDIVGDSAINKTNSDINGDGKVTLTDLSQLKTMIEESKVKSPLIELTDAEINAKYSQYKKYLTHHKTYYIQNTDLTGLSNSCGEIRILGNLILDKQLKRLNTSNYAINIEGSLVFLGKAAANGIANIYGTFCYSPEKVSISNDYIGPNLDVNVYGDVYINSNPYNKLADRDKYGVEKIEIKRNDTLSYGIYFAPNAYMELEDLSCIKNAFIPYSINRPINASPLYFYDSSMTDSYVSGENLFRDGDLKYISIKYNDFPKYGFMHGYRDYLLESKYKGRIKAIVALLLNNNTSRLEKLPFIKIERAGTYRQATIYDSDGGIHFYVKINKNNGVYRGVFNHYGKEYSFDVILSNEYSDFSKRLSDALNGASDNLGAKSGYKAIIRSVFESGFDYYLYEHGSSREFACQKRTSVNNYGEKYYTYPIVDCLNIAGPYVDFIFMKGQRPYDYGIKSPEPNPSQDTVLSPEELQAKLEAQEKDLYEIIVNAIGNEYVNKQSTYEMEGLEELKKNIKLTNNVKLDDDMYMAFLEPLKNKISDTIIKKYDSKVGINFVFDISNMLYTGLEKVKDRKVTSGGKVYTLKYDMSWSVHGILVASATLYDYKNSEVTHMTLTNLDTEEGAKNLAQYATGLAILNKDVEENATYEVMKEVFKEITNDRKTASKLAKTLKFGQEITNAMLTDEAAKNFAEDRGGELKDLIDKKGQGFLINTARNCVRGIVEKYVPNGKNIVKAVDQIDKINKTITKYSNIYKTYNSYNSKTSADELKKAELEFNSYSEVLSKIFSAIR